MLIRLRVFASGNIAVSHADNSSACGAPLNGAIGTPEIPLINKHCSRMGWSDSSAGGGDDRKLSGLFGQNWSMMTPCGMYMKARRTGGLFGFPGPAAAQLMDSKRGSASEAPIPFRQVRRFIKKLLRMG